jgi:glutamate-1-semialdehyde 2,1-aminomutase
MTTETRAASEKIYADLKEVIPGGVNSPVRSFPGLQRTPMIAASGKGDRVTDVDGRSYIDYCCSWGPLILGHAPKEVLDHVKKRIDLGTSFGITTEIEQRMARHLVDRIPSIEKIRFVSSGTEACMSAIRLARGFTGRDLIIKFTGHYHGHADYLLVQAGSGVAGLNPSASSAGVPADFIKHTLCLPFNDEEMFERVLARSDVADRLAAVILEPVAANMGCVAGEDRFLKLVREKTREVGALLIFDEVITGFRLSRQGAQGVEAWRDIVPDLTCYGKIIGGGFPVGAFGGRADIMNYLAPLGQVYQAGTLSGNPVAMEAGYQTLIRTNSDEFYMELERKARVIVDAVEAEIERRDLPLSMQRVGSLFCLYFKRGKIHSMEDAKGSDLGLFAKFFQHMFDRGVYIPPSQFETWFMSSAHTEESLEITRDEVLNFLSGM